MAAAARAAFAAGLMGDANELAELKRQLAPLFRHPKVQAVIDQTSHQPYGALTTAILEMIDGTVPDVGQYGTFRSGSRVYKIRGYGAHGDDHYLTAYEEGYGYD